MVGGPSEIRSVAAVCGGHRADATCARTLSSPARAFLIPTCPTERAPESASGACCRPMPSSHGATLIGWGYIVDRVGRGRAGMGSALTAGAAFARRRSPARRGRQPSVACGIAAASSIRPVSTGGPMVPAGSGGPGGGNSGIPAQPLEAAWCLGDSRLAETPASRGPAVPRSGSRCPRVFAGLRWSPHPRPPRRRGR